MRPRFALAATILAIASACSRSASPTSATAVTVADFHGQYTGTYKVTSCAADGTFTGFCEAGGLTAGTTLPITLSLTQNQSDVTGSVTLGSFQGTFQGTVSGSSLTGTATFSTVDELGGALNMNITSWNTTIAGNALAGSFTLVLRSPGSSGSATLAATITQVTR